MQEEQKRDLLVLITSLADAYSYRISEHKLELYWRLLKNYELIDIQSVMQRYTSIPELGKEMPKPKDFIHLLTGSHYGRAKKAWDKVYHAIRKIGMYGSVVFDDPLIHAVITDMGGWVTLCQSPIQEEGFRERDFETRYYDYLLKPPRNYLKKLTGILDSRLVQLIGDEKKALEVLQKGDSPLKLLESRTITSLLLPSPAAPPAAGEEHDYT